MEESLTILVPVYNEENCIEQLVLEMNLFLYVVGIPTTVLFVNDGSTDKSGEHIERVCKEDPRYSFISLKQNAGLSAALKAGIDSCTSKYIGYIDSDLQTTPMDFLELMKYIQDFDLVLGYREDRQDKIVKKISSSIANSFRQWLLEDTIIDTGCPLKLMHTEIAKKFPFFKGMHRFIPNMVTLLLGSVKQIPVRHFPRYAGTPKYHLLNRLIGPFTDAIAFRWMQRRVIHYEINKRSQ